MLGIEEQLVMGPCYSFVKEIAALVAGYYNANLQYAEDSSKCHFTWWLKS